ncbi:MAG: OmpA family protein [Prolixibacteraceae bacterium]|nr:OmpA family protein [Prolixibacteraceae bacterium]MBT6005228.1 OmpA family protein [Prolixibacteraceae bacterium]MBT6763165.1 OmpA family protein [Prolixibacteraceae bacterium]MBT6998961.1 OmpA family protein [Prolixibacteraceae bacterium]MBT7393910.1 OmpA family protein [Prolixibacteraceae bacterium]
MNAIQKTLVLSLLIFSASCVSTKQFSEVQDKLRNYASENEQLKHGKMELEAANTELTSKNEQLSAQNRELSAQLEESLYKLNVEKQNVNVLEKESADLQRQMEMLNSGSSSEIEKLLEELLSARHDLNNREDKLRGAEKELEDRNAKLIELQNILAQKDQAVKDLKSKVVDALVGFNNNGLTVHEKNGKVYVSLDEKLLFKTGKWDIDPNGQNAIRELSKVLAQNTDINIMVEGHTDDVPMHGLGDVKDNWDLSVMRSTAVTKILTQNKQIDPKRIISAGRSEYLPLSPDKIAEARQMNRRTEIILTPKLDELLKLLELN